jgi:putative addiction module component (TIGR02574 family)
MKYKVALYRTKEGYAVSVPGLPGCWSQGATEAEALANIQDAIQDYLAARDELLAGADVRDVEFLGLTMPTMPDSLRPEDVPVTDAQREELDRRLDDLEGDPDLGIPWDEVLRRIRERGR